MLMIDLRREAEWKRTREVAEKIAKFVPFSTDFERFLWLRRLPPKRIETILESLGRIGKYRGWEFLLSGEILTVTAREALRLYREFLCSRYYDRLYPLLKARFVRGKIPLEREFEGYLANRKMSPYRIREFVRVLRRIAQRSLSALLNAVGETASEREALGYYREFVCATFKKSFEKWMKKDMRRA